MTNTETKTEIKVTGKEWDEMNEIERSKVWEQVRNYERSFKLTPGAYRLADKMTHDCGSDCEPIRITPTQWTWKCKGCGAKHTVGNVWN